MIQPSHSAAAESAHIAQASLLQPIDASQRIDVLDILRGFALIGILLMNIEWFSRPLNELGSFSSQLSGIDHAVGWLIACFVQGKFYKLFALLFGMGFAVMLQRAIDAGRPFTMWFVRRMGVLFIIGCLHMILLWNGDILHDYAVAGLLLLGFLGLLRRPRWQHYQQPAAMLKLALWWLAIPPILVLVVGIGFNVLSDRHELEQRWHFNQQVEQVLQQLKARADSTEQSAPLDLPADAEKLDSPEYEARQRFEEWQQQEQEKAAEIHAFRYGSYAQATAERIKIAGQWLLFTPFFAVMQLLPIFILGYWLVSSGIITHYQQHAGLFRVMRNVGLSAGLPLSIGGFGISVHPAVEHVTEIQFSGEFMFTCGEYFMAAGYLGLLLSWLQHQRWQRRLAILAPLGRMALSNYLMHSIILTTVFYGYAGGWYGQIARAPQMLLVLAILTVQIPLSVWWLRYFRFGPMEWLWRSLTYQQWQRFRL